MSDPVQEHIATFRDREEQSRLTHLIEHGHWLDNIRQENQQEHEALHRDAHETAASRGDTGDGFSPPPDLPVLADKAVKVADGMRKHLHAQDWPSAYAAADWLMDVAHEIKSAVWAAHPGARPENWSA